MLAPFTWNIPADFIEKNHSMTFRIYVTLSYAGTELNPPQSPCNSSPANAALPCTPKMALLATDPNWDQNAPGQNNEGYSQITLQAPSIQTTPPGGGPRLTNLTTSQNSLAALDSVGNLKSGFAVAYLGRPLRLRVMALSEYSDVQERQSVLVLDGPPATGTTIAGKTLQGVATGGSYAWLNWTPTTLGLHQLTAQITEPQNDLVKGDNLAQLLVTVVRLPGDVNGDGLVDARDTEIILENVGKPVSESACGKDCDLNGDGLIGRMDLDLAIANCDHTACAVAGTVSQAKKAVKK